MEATLNKYTQNVTLLIRILIRINVKAETCIDMLRSFKEPGKSKKIINNNK